MKIEKININEIKPYKLNAKKHPSEQVESLKNSINKFGFTQPIVVDDSNTIIIGHGRFEACKLLKLIEVPIVRMQGLTENEVKALRLIDNRISETGWDASKLDIDLSNITFDFSPYNINFDKELESIKEILEESSCDEEVLEDLDEDVYVKDGDLFQLGDHKLLCGDSTKDKNYKRLFGQEIPLLMIADPPYGVNYNPTWRKKFRKIKTTSKIKNDDLASWELTYKLFTGDVVYVWHGALKSDVVKQDLEKAGFEIKSQLIWNKTIHVLSRSHYHWKHESCWYAIRKLKNGNWKGGRDKKTVIDLHSRTSLAGLKDTDEKSNHSTQKPVELIKQLISNHTDLGDLVYDPFLGSGTTLIAAEKLKRKCYGIELDPRFCQQIINRWRKITGENAIKLR